MRFPKSKLYESAFTPIIIGLIVGFIAAIMGIGGAFILVPAMIYIIGMPTKLVPGTSLFATVFVSAIVTILHAFNYGSIDLILVSMLILGSIIRVQIGQKLGEFVDSSELKALLALETTSSRTSHANPRSLMSPSSKLVNAVTASIFRSPFS